MSQSSSKETIQIAFEAWANGQGAGFSLLHDDVHWTVAGTSALAGTYTSRQQFLDEAVEPISQRLAQPIRPTVRSIVAEGDTVVVLWDGHATALDDQPYDNTYIWHMRFNGPSIVEVVAFLDSPTLDDLLARVSVPSP